MYSEKSHLVQSRGCARLSLERENVRIPGLSFSFELSAPVRGSVSRLVSHTVLVLNRSGVAAEPPGLRDLFVTQIYCVCRDCLILFID
jgi:hypothetical protein